MGGGRLPNRGVFDHWLGNGHTFVTRFWVRKSKKNTTTNTYEIKVWNLCHCPAETGPYKDWKNINETRWCLNAIGRPGSPAFPSQPGQLASSQGKNKKYTNYAKDVIWYLKSWISRNKFTKRNIVFRNITFSSIFYLPCYYPGFDKNKLLSTG